MVTSKKTPFDPKSPIASQWYCCYSAQASASGTSPSCTSAHDVAISPTSSSSGAGAGAAAGAGAVPSSSKAGGAVTGAVASSSTAATVGTSETTGAGAVATSETTAAAAVTGGGTEEIANSSTSDADADVQAQTEASTTVGSSTTAEVAAEVETASGEGDTLPDLNNIISEKYLAEGDDAGDADDVSSEVDEIIGFFNTVNDRNHDIMPLNIGLITSSTGEELRIILSKVDSKEYINIRGTCLPYLDMKKMFEDFDFMEETIKDAAPKPQTTSLQQWLLIFMLSFSSFLIIYDAYMPKLNS